MWCVRGRSSLKSEPKVISEGGGVHPKGKPTETDPRKCTPELKPRYLHLLFMCSFYFIFFLFFTIPTWALGGFVKSQEAP